MKPYYLLGNEEKTKPGDEYLINTSIWRQNWETKPEWTGRKVVDIVVIVPTSGPQCTLIRRPIIPVNELTPEKSFEVTSEYEITMKRKITVK